MSQSCCVMCFLLDAVPAPGVNVVRVLLRPLPVLALKHVVHVGEVQAGHGARAVQVLLLDLLDVLGLHLPRPDHQASQPGHDHAEHDHGEGEADGEVGLQGDGLHGDARHGGVLGGGQGHQVGGVALVTRLIHGDDRQEDCAVVGDPVGLQAQGDQLREAGGLGVVQAAAVDEVGGL